MAEFTLAAESKDQGQEYPVVISRFENGVEQRRLTHGGTEGTVALQSPLVTAAGLAAYTAFYATQNGPLTSFTWDSDFDSNTYNVRFEGPLRISFARGTYRCEFDFVLLSVV